ncbi:hypothetical protein ACHAW6_002023 [Cyclotella cf. meneghiniana]
MVLRKEANQKQSLFRSTRILLPTGIFLCACFSMISSHFIAKSFTQQGVLPGVYNETYLQLYMYKRRSDLLNQSSVMSIECRNDQHYPWIVQHHLAKHPGFETANNDETEYFNIFSDASRGNLVYGGASAYMCAPVKAFNMSGGAKKHVLILQVNENWGAFSSLVKGRTIDWGDFFVNWKNQGCHDAKQLYEYLDHPNVSAVFTTTHQSAIEPHPKVYSLPLGVFSAARATEELHAQPQMMNRSQLLMINFNSDTAYSDYGRLKIEKSVIANFNGTLKNTYNTGGQALYWQELRQSKFVLCPSGLGWDTYRAWEALVMGAIPVLETFYRKDGFYRTYDDLPVLWVDHYDNVTPSLLEEA